MEFMAGNLSVAFNESLSRRNERVIVIQVFVLVFLCINTVLIVVFFTKEIFRTTMRYILFVNALHADSLILIISDVILIMNFLGVKSQVWSCIIIFTVSSIYVHATPITLTAMTLERYVAVCMPLRHSALCATHRALPIIVIIYTLSFLPSISFLLCLFVFSTHSNYYRDIVCSVDMLVILSWQRHLRSAISQFFFLIMAVIIVFSYMEIMRVAKAASVESKKSARNSLRTVVLHGFQLLLSLTQMWCPFTEGAALQINVILFMNVRYFNYIMFILVPRCLSPLVYGLRDKMYFQALKNHVLCGLSKSK